MDGRNEWKMAIMQKQKPQLLINAAKNVSIPFHPIPSEGIDCVALFGAQCGKTARWPTITIPSRFSFKGIALQEKFLECGWYSYVMVMLMLMLMAVRTARTVSLCPSFYIYSVLLQSDCYCCFLYLHLDICIGSIGWFYKSAEFGWDRASLDIGYHQGATVASEASLIIFTFTVSLLRYIFIFN